MPKKHAPAYTTTKPNYVHPSLQSSRSTTSSAPAESRTVNQRIAQLRREQAPRATAEQRNEINSLVSSRTVPPDLRRILHIPEINAPKPKAGSRLRTRGLGGARPPPGPAAPTSWLRTSRYAPTKGQIPLLHQAEAWKSRFGHLATTTEKDFKHLFPPSRSLQHLCLRTFAEHWVELSVYEQHHIPTLPVRTREALLSYLALYGDEDCLDFDSFKILFQNVGDTTHGWEDVHFLDLTGLLNEGFTINDLAKCLKRVLPQIIEEFELLSICKGSSMSKAKVKATVIADSWEEEADDVENSLEVLPAQLVTPHFSNLSRLSLAHAGECASWADLLRLSPNLNKITHLSLAYWPRPTLTPNSVTATMVAPHARVALGGTSYYADLDDDWHEPANILRRFSANTYSLLWLDLESCSWLPALMYNGGRDGPDGIEARPAPALAVRPDEDAWGTQAVDGPDWNDSWRRVTYLNFFQGWIPSDKKSLQNMPAGVLPVELMRWLREHGKDEKWKLNAKERGYEVAEWLEREKVARLTMTRLSTTLFLKIVGVLKCCEVIQATCWRLGYWTRALAALGAAGPMRRRHTVIPLVL
ncbi:hypothetical protein CC86DRAFT_385244 [Ophiobolus disseminans]|uniref:Uncharacterized protein n=1 Tax=Ophiobolus disseminans TaxID=1469910 RepID=A0A6A6ZQH8_9PLEO|nr:hypothetical protein CC86DRAFT_385244 [Ophiobolus disseminans]